MCWASGLCTACAAPGAVSPADCSAARRSVAWADQSAGQALFSSTLAVWRCRGAFVVYGLTWFALMLAFGLVSAVLFGLLGLGQLASLLALPAGLFFSTLFYVSLIFTFNDSFSSQ